jgi:predicted methyltransferase
LLNGYHEYDITIITLNLLKEGQLCIDVGANCGYYTILFSKIVITTKEGANSVEVLHYEGVLIGEGVASFKK